MDTFPWSFISSLAFFHHDLCNLFVSSEADNEVIVEETDIEVSEDMGQVYVCAEIVDVTEIETGFTGQFEVETTSASKY